ncbi:MAG: BtpA/SgcQ family protein [Dehalococcoidia bacterium]|jgi:hypothetical protein|nr:BtpA/SgcQ family protein [Dehalococcoidia bacterium]
MNRFADLFSAPRPIIGVIHLPALPGSTGSPGLGEVLKRALTDLAALEGGGVHGVLVSNDGDQPRRLKAGADTISALTRVAHEIVLASNGVKVGVQVLLNDPEASVAVAQMAGASFIRTDFFVDAMQRPEYGPIEIAPQQLVEYRAGIGAGDLLILADVQVKYAQMIDPRPLADSAAQAVECAADAIVVTGSVTGEAPAWASLREAKQGAGHCPVLVGSGLDLSNAADLLRTADGAIVGTSLKTGAYVDAGKVRALMAAVSALDSRP